MIAFLLSIFSWSLFFLIFNTQVLHSCPNKVCSCWGTCVEDVEETPKLEDLHARLKRGNRRRACRSSLCGTAINNLPPRSLPIKRGPRYLSFDLEERVAVVYLELEGAWSLLSGGNSYPRTRRSKHLGPALHCIFRHFSA